MLDFAEIRKQADEARAEKIRLEAEREAQREAEPKITLQVTDREWIVIQKALAMRGGACVSITYSEADKTLSADLNRRLMQQRRDFCNFQLEVAEEAKRRHEQAEQELTATITLVKPRRTRRSKYHV